VTLDPGQTPVDAKKKPKADDKAAAAAEPASLVANSVDAATQIALEAAKAAQAEADKLAAIGTDKAAPATGKVVEVAVAGTVAAAKEIKKAKKEVDAQNAAEKSKAPANENADATPEPKAPKAKKAAKDA
jgi:hypothetical protein